MITRREEKRRSKNDNVNEPKQVEYENIVWERKACQWPLLKAETKRDMLRGTCSSVVNNRRLNKRDGLVEAVGKCFLLKQ